MKLIALAVVLLTLGLSTSQASVLRMSAQPSPRIVLDRSIGGVTLGEARGNIEGRIGKGRVDVVIPSSAFYVVYLRYGLRILYLRSAGHDHVKQVEARSPRYRTPQGVGVGSTRAAVRRLPGHVACGDSCQHYQARPDGPSTTFAFDKRGRVNWVAVGSAS